MKRFGEKLRRLRQGRSLTMRELASHLDIQSHSHFVDMENGRSLPSIELLVKIADYFGVTTDQLLRDDQEIE
ncbi:MAG: helix-turn-helix transcriptional regulator [Caldilineaceae bacterium]